MNREVYTEWLKFVDSYECNDMDFTMKDGCIGCKFGLSCDEFLSIQDGTSMFIETIDDNNTDFEKVELIDDGNIGRLTPHCKVHGAMNKVSKFDGGGYWRCSASNKEFGNCRAGCIEYKEEVKDEN